MDFTTIGQDHDKRIALSGQFTFSDHQKFKQLMELVGDDLTQSVTLDFARVDFIDSGALGMLLLLHDACQARHIPISIDNAQGQVEKILLISKFDQLFSE